jgi:hypothetical protein
VPVDVGPVVVGGESSLEMTSAITVAATTRTTTTIATRAMPLKGFFRGSLGGGSGCIPHARLARLRPAIVTLPGSRRRGLAVRSEAVVDLYRSERMGEAPHPTGTVCEEAVGSPSNRGGTMTTLMDTVRIEAPERSPVRPVSPLDPSWDDDSEIPSTERSLQDRSHSTQWDRLAMGRGQPLWSEAA